MIAAAVKEVKPEFLKTEEAMAYLNIGRTTFYKWAKILRIRKVKRGGVVRWRRSELERMMESAEKIVR